MTDKTYITKGKGLPNWSNPISHAVVANNMCFVSGQLAVNEAGQFIPGTIHEEAELAFKNFFCALKHAGFSPTDVVFVDIAFTDLSQLKQVNTLYTQLFPQNRPARTIYQVAALPFNGKVKVMGTAVKTP